MTDSILPAGADCLPDPIPPDTLADHLPDPIPPDTLAEHLPDPIPPDILLDAQADSIAPAPPWGERRGDGDHYAPVPYVDPGGQQPEVIGTLCGRGLKDPSCSQVFTFDRRRYRSNRGRFRPSSEDRRRSYRSNRDRFKKSINYKTLVMGPVSPTKLENGICTSVFYFVRMKREDNPNKWET